VRLDETLRGEGVAAFRGKHRDQGDKHALGRFLAPARNGRVPQGSFPIVESLDRLSRENIRPALSLVPELIEHGIRDVQLSPVEQVYDDKVEVMALMLALVERSRGTANVE
jgi:DNA invertase Pin-like site-specific DNA recombinase